MCRAGPEHTVYHIVIAVPIFLQDDRERHRKVIRPSLPRQDRSSQVMYRRLPLTEEDGLRKAKTKIHDKD